VALLRMTNRMLIEGAKSKGAGVSFETTPLAAVFSKIRVRLPDHNLCDNGIMRKVRVKLAFPARSAIEG
jgi:hypothetical protein